MNDEYLDFLETVTAKLDHAVAQFKRWANRAGAKSIEQAVVLCEEHPAYATFREKNIGSMREVFEAWIRDAMHRRTDVGERLAALLRRIEALARIGLHRIDHAYGASPGNGPFTSRVIASMTVHTRSNGTTITASSCCPGGTCCRMTRLPSSSLETAIASTRLTTTELPFDQLKSLGSAMLHLHNDKK
jgi:hypothetical protein